MSFGIAVVGLDHWYTGFGVLDTAHKNEKATLRAVWDKDPSRRAEVQAKYSDVVVPQSADDAFRRADVDMVAVCAATDEAVPICKAALKAGKHVLSVKPPARTLAELDSVIDVAKSSGKFYASFEGMQRLHPRNIKLRELIQGGAIGTPLSYHKIAHGGLPSPWPGKSGQSWWLDKKHVPGGAWIDHAIYDVDLARFVFGGEITDVHAHMGNRTHSALAVEDYGISLMQVGTSGLSNPGSVSLIFEDTWSNEAGGGASRMQIIGTRGTIEPSGDSWVVKSGGKETRHEVAPAAFFQLTALAELLQAGKNPPFTYADARANLEACLKAYRSAGR